jgi:hypothetical protein
MNKIKDEEDRNINMEKGNRPYIQDIAFYKARFQKVQK